MQKQEQELKVIEFLLKEEDKITGDIDLISIVQDPATEQSFQLFSKAKITKKEYKFSEEGEQRVVTGLIMRPNLKILRVDMAGEPYYCWFSEDTVRQAAQLYMKKSNNHKTSLEHSNYELNEGVYMFESWLETDPETSSLAKARGFADVQRGDWFGSYKIEDPSLWAYLKSHYNNGTAGFSLEGFFTMSEEIFNKVETNIDKKTYDKIQSVLASENLTDKEIFEQIQEIFGTK